MEALQRLHNRGSISTGYEIDNSCKFEPDNSEYLTKSQSNGNKKTWTCSFWFKRTELNDSDFPAFISASSSSWQTRIAIFNNGALWVDLGYGTSYYRNIANALIRDTSAWYHVVVAVDSTQATDSNRLKVYLNGELITSWNTQNYPAQNTEFKFFDSNHAMFIGTTNATDFRFAGYIADMHVVDGTQLAQTDFGEFDEDSGIWKPKAYTGSYGSQGFYLDFSDSANLGDDASGNSNDFTETNITAADQATDTPTNNFTTFNIVRRYNQGRISFTEGGTVVNTITSGNTWTTVFNTMAVNKGKWYWEGELYAGGGYQMFGQTPQPWTETNINIDWYLGQRSDKQNGAAYYGSGADVYYEGTYAHSSANATGDIISVAMDCDNNKVHFAVNGVYTNSSNPVNNTNGFAMLDDYQYFAMATYIGSYALKANFGGYTTISISSAESDADGYGTFEYAPPSGYYALCTKNLEEYG